jgi:hypothetical protein
MIEQQAMDLLAADAGQIFGTGLDQQIGGPDTRETIRRTGAAQQAVEERLFQLPVPIQAFFDQGPQQRDPAPGHPRFVPRGAEDGTGHLAESATIAAGDLVVMLFDAHLRGTR